MLCCVAPRKALGPANREDAHQGIIAHMIAAHYLETLDPEPVSRRVLSNLCSNHPAERHG